MAGRRDQAGVDRGTEAPQLGRVKTAAGMPRNDWAGCPGRRGEEEQARLQARSDNPRFVERQRSLASEGPTGSPSEQRVQQNAMLSDSAGAEGSRRPRRRAEEQRPRGPQRSDSREVEGDRNGSPEAEGGAEATPTPSPPERRGPPGPTRDGGRPQQSGECDTSRKITRSTPLCVAD